MCRKTKSYNPINPSSGQLFDPGKCSVLDTKETLLHFSRDERHIKAHRSDFFYTYYRCRNLDLANLLSRSKFADDETVNKCIRHTRWCSSLGIISVTPQNTAHVMKSSKSCKNPFCHICQRRKAARMVSRLKAFLMDPENFELLKDKRWYMLTLTVKHNESVRVGNYLAEFKSYVKKLRRTKAWKEAFNHGSKKVVHGSINSIENVISWKGYHIHSHSLICAPRLSAPVARLETALRLAWTKITGDSDQIRLDLLKDFATTMEATDQLTEKQINTKAALEVFKYSTKIGDFQTKDKPTIDNIAAWVRDSKGKNFMNVQGILRGFGLTSAKCKYDTEAPAVEYKLENVYYIDAISSLKKNVNVSKSFTKKIRQKVEEIFHIIGVSDDAINITDIVDEINDMMICEGSEEKLKFDLPDIIALIRKRIEIESSFNSNFGIDLPVDTERASRVAKQLNFLDKFYTTDNKLPSSSNMLEHW